MIGVKINPIRLNNLWRLVGRYLLLRVADRFSTSTDPNGRPWKARKDKKTHPLLVETGKLKSSFRSQVTQNGISIKSLDSKFDFHQLGTKFIPARPMLPPDNKLPATWLAGIETIIKSQLELI